MWTIMAYFEHNFEFYSDFNNANVTFPRLSANISSLQIQIFMELQQMEVGNCVLIKLVGKYWNCVTVWYENQIDESWLNHWISLVLYIFSVLHKLQKAIIQFYGNMNFSGTRAPPHWSLDKLRILAFLFHQNCVTHRLNKCHSAQSTVMVDLSLSSEFVFSYLLVYLSVYTNN